MSRYASNDIPPTDAELEQFYGRPVTQPEINEAVGRYAAAFDKDDLMNVLYEHGDRIISALAIGRPDFAGALMECYRCETIARRASMELYGKPDVIKASEVVS